MEGKGTGQNNVFLPHANDSFSIQRGKEQFTYSMCSTGVLQYLSFLQWESMSAVCCPTKWTVSSTSSKIVKKCYYLQKCQRQYSQLGIDSRIILSQHMGVNQVICLKGHFTLFAKTYMLMTFRIFNTLSWGSLCVWYVVSDIIDTCGLTSFLDYNSHNTQLLVVDSGGLPYWENMQAKIYD